MLFGLNITKDENIELSIFLDTNTGAGRPAKLWAGRAVMDEEQIIAQISRSAVAMRVIERAHSRDLVLKDEFGTYVVPVRIQWSALGQPTSEHRTEIMLDTAEEAENDIQQTIHLVKSLTDISSRTISSLNESAQTAIMEVSKASALALGKAYEAISKVSEAIDKVHSSANHAIGQVANAHAQSVKAASESIDKLSSLPIEIFKDSTDKTAAMLSLAQSQNEATKQQAPSDLKTVVSDAKELMGLVSAFKQMAPQTNKGS